MESKALTYEELFKDAQEEIESLKEKVALLEKQVAIEEGINICNGVDDLQIPISNENDEINNVDSNDDDINSFDDDDDGDNINNNVNDSLLNEIIQYTSCDDQQPQSSRCFTAFTTITNPSPITSSFSFNDQHRLVNQSSQVSCGLPPSMLNSLESVEDIIRDPIFCETKEGDLCFCEPDEDLINEVSTIGIDKRLSNNKEKKMWILRQALSHPITTQVATTYPNFTTNDYSLNNGETSSHWGPYQQNYFSPAVSSAVVTTTTNSLTQISPLNLKWILGD